MYDQNKVTYIHELIKRAIKEMERTTNLHINIMTRNGDYIKKRLLMGLKYDFGPFLGSHFKTIEEMINEHIRSIIADYSFKLNETDKAIMVQYKRLEIEIQTALSRVPNWFEFKSVIDDLNNEMLSRLHEIGKRNNNEVIDKIEQLFINIQNKIILYLINIGITNGSLVRAIRQLIDIYQYTLLDQIGDKIFFLISSSQNVARQLSLDIINKVNSEINEKPVNNNIIDPSMLKI